MWVFIHISYQVYFRAQGCFAFGHFLDQNAETNHNEIIVVYKTKFDVMV
jgi:hypothetical protein